MSAQEAPNPVKEMADMGSVAADGASSTVAVTTTATSVSPSAPLAVTVKKEPGTPGTSNGKVTDPKPAEICVVIGGSDGRGGRRPMGAQEAPSRGPEKADVGNVAAEGPSSTGVMSTAAMTVSPSAPLAVTVKTEPGTAGTSNGKVGDPNPAEICVVIGGSNGRGSLGGSRGSQTQGMFALGTPPPTKSTDTCIGLCQYCIRIYTPISWQQL